MKNNKHLTLKPMTLVKFNFKDTPVIYHKQYPFSEVDRFVYLGDIKQMPGHCVIVNTKTGQMHCCYHTSNFIEVPEEEC